MIEGQAQDQAGNDRHFIRLEDVGRHAGAVADVIADEVRDDGGVARVVFGDAGFNFADQVGADVGSLGVDAATDAHEEGQQGAAEAEAQQCVRGGNAEIHEDQRAAEQAQAVGQHAGDRAGAISDAQGIAERAAGGLRHAHIGRHGHAHANLADHQREERTHDKGDRTAYADDHLDLFRVATGFG